MSVEVCSLVVLTIFFLFAWLPGSAAKGITYGPSFIFSNRDTRGLPPLPDWGGRVDRAYENLKSFFPAFVVAIVLLAQRGISDAGTEYAATAFVICRFLHFFVYAMGWVTPRAIFWISGMLINLYLLLRLWA